MVLLRFGLSILLLVFGITGSSPRQAAAQTPVSIELVLAVDTSLSVNDIEFRLQMKGIAAALRSPDVINLIMSYDGVAITLIQWAGWTNKENWLPWHRLKSRQSIEALARDIENIKRDRVGNLTGIGTAIEAGLFALANNQFVGRQMKIDVSGDGISNIGIEPNEARLRAVAAGVTINGLAIILNDSGLDAYYAEHVITGPGAFVIKAKDHGDFARAMRLKLLRELAPAVSGLEPQNRSKYSSCSHCETAAR
ncbi:MAG: DUF1194 domain-containing protein [Hyphomicrobiales bacterium]|nr:DUF1194 domain-containing protein [Hyphomicrobiales bacterium]